MQIQYEDYLTEHKLINIFQQIFGAADIIPQFKYQHPLYKRYTYDILIRSLNTIIEFDGDMHYTDINTIQRDLIKDTITIEGFSIIRIPYFIQLTTEVFNYFFPQITITIKQDFPHGFINKKAKLPSNFCSHGELKFLYDLEKFSFIKKDILRSLQSKQIEKEFIVGVGFLKNLI